MSSSVLDEVVAGRAPAIMLITVEQFHRMIEAGILSDGEPVELIEGMLVHKDRSEAGKSSATHGKRHAVTVAVVQSLIGLEAEPAGFHVRTQLPVTLSDTSEPEPDLVVANGPRQTYLQGHPRPSDVRLLVEVSDSSLLYDRTVKQRLYAAAGITPYWIVNLVDDQVEVHDYPNPAGGRYEQITIVKPGQTLDSGEGADGLRIRLRVEQLLPKL